MKKTPIISIKNLSKIYQTEVLKTVALDNVSFEVQKGEYVAIMGPSGSGKSTLMHIIGALDKPTAGTYYLDGQDVSELNDDQLAEIRNQKIGFIFQAYNLLPRTTTVKNVMLPMAYAGIDKEERENRAIKYLKLVGLGDHLKHTSNQLSGGQQQRVAIARAQAKEIMAIFKKINDQGNTIIMITHEEDIAEHAKRIIMIRDGKIVSDNLNRQQKINKKL